MFYSDAEHSDILWGSADICCYCFILGKRRGSRNWQNIENLCRNFVSSELKTMLKPFAMWLLNVPLKSTYSSSTVAKPKESALEIKERLKQ